MALWLPFEPVRHAYRWVRRTVFTRKGTDGPYLRLDGYSIPDLVCILGAQGFYPNEWASYNYRGEDLNMARPEYEAESHPGIEWWQLHVRGFERVVGDETDTETVYLNAHYEPHTLEHPRAHLAENGFSIGEGMAELRWHLDAAGVPFERVETANVIE